jgi:hypothetical protein
MKTTILTALRTIVFATAFAIAPLATQAASPLPSELLEKGIYAEETKGDLDAAISIYQQLVGEAKAGQSLGAQAQFRLGQCLLKKGRVVEAQTAFEKLTRDFPNEKELIAKAREHLPGDIALGPVPWVNGERLQLVIGFPTGFEIGVTEYRADLLETDGRKIWRVGARTAAGGQSFSSVDVDAETFRPIRSRWKHVLLGDVSAVYGAGEVETKRVGSAETKKISFDKTVFDNEQTVHVMRRLPLEVGYKTTIPIIATLGASTVIQVGFEVLAEESVKTPAGEFDCFKAQLSIGQTFWFSKDAHRYLVKFEAGGAVANLVSIAQHQLPQPVQFHDEALGVALTTPPDWVVQKQKTPKSTVIHLLDPQAETDDVSLQIRATDSLSAGARSSARAWADADFLENATKELKDIKVRPQSWKNHVIAERSAVSCVADYGDKEKPMVRLCVYLPGPKTSEQFTLICEAEKFEALRGPFESIVASYRKK